MALSWLWSLGHHVCPHWVLIDAVAGLFLSRLACGSPFTLVFPQGPISLWAFRYCWTQQSFLGWICVFPVHDRLCHSANTDPFDGAWDAEPRPGASMCSRPDKPILASSLYQCAANETSLCHAPSISPTGIYMNRSDSDPMAQGSSTLSPYSVSVPMSPFAHKNTHVFINSFCLLRISLSAPLLTTKLPLSPEHFCHLRICSTENIHLKVCAKKLPAPLFSCYKFISPPSGSLPLDFSRQTHAMPSSSDDPPASASQQKSQDVSPILAPSYQYTVITDIDILVIILGLFNLILQFVPKQGKFKSQNDRERACSETS